MQNLDFRRIRDWLSGGLLLLALMGGGAGVGYWVGTENVKTLIAEMRRAHLDEISRLQAANQTALEATAASVENAAANVAKAVATKPAPVVIKQAPPPAPAPPNLDAARKAVNNSIQRANGQLSERPAP